MFEAELNAAFERHRVGLLQQAEADYREILSRDPDQPDALHGLGTIALQRDQPELAVELISRAIIHRPESMSFHSNLGMAHQKLRQYDAAETALRRATELAPNNEAVHFNLANLLKARKKMAEAICEYREAIRLKPSHTSAYNNLGNCYSELGHYDNARKAFEQLLRLDPEYAEAHLNLGTVLMKAADFGAADSEYRRAVLLKPSLIEAWVSLGASLSHQGKFAEMIQCFRDAAEQNLDAPAAQVDFGNALKKSGQLEDAMVCYRRAIAASPDYATAHMNLGNALNEQGKLNEASACYHRALELKPDFAEAHSNLSIVELDQGNVDAAIAGCRRAVDLKPEYVEAHSNLGNALKEQARLHDAIACYRKAIAIQSNQPKIHSNLAYVQVFHAGLSGPAILEECRRWNAAHGEPLARQIKPWLNDRNPDRPLRVGYVSPDFHTHCQAFFTVPLFASHDRSQFEIVGYSDVTRPDAITDRLRSHTTLWRETVGLNHAQVADLIRSDRIDILVDLTMHMSHNRLRVFAQKPAPVQVSWLAYPGTTGVAAIDYRLTDQYLDPPGEHEDHYSERSIRLPDTFWCYDPLDHKPEVNELPSDRNGYVTFGCLNNFCKVNLFVLKLWASVLKAVDRSRLVILSKEGSHRRETLDVFECEGVAADRITFVPYKPRPQYLRRYHEIDIGLDTVPYNGHTTSLDSFWMGVPVVTLVGSTVVGRAGLCQLMNLGLSELIAHQPEEFVQIAAKLATDLPRLRSLRQGLRDRMKASPLMDAPRFARNVESAYRAIWQQWCLNPEK